MFVRLRWQKEETPYALKVLQNEHHSNSDGFSNMRTLGNIIIRASKNTSKHLQCLHIAKRLVLLQKILNAKAIN